MNFLKFFSFKFLMIFLIGVLNTQVLAELENQVSILEIEPKKNYTKKLQVSTERGDVYFQIHAGGSHLGYAQRVKTILEDYSKKIFDYFEYEPTTPIHFILDTSSTRANGSARTFPRNKIELIIRAPLSESHLITGDDWVKGLVLHELVHIAHLDQTRGFVEGARAAFGSIAKVLVGIVPRWFAEGIATWAETEFTEGGRLRHSTLRYELDAKLLDPTFCRRVDCLDNPGVYPFRSSAYWLGSLFLDFLEKKRPGTIRCMVHVNSRRIGFLLNETFRQCVDLDVQESFNLFRSAYVGEIQQRQKRFNLREKLPEVKRLDIAREGDPIWSKNFALKDGHLYLLQAGDRTEHLRKWNLEKNSSEEIEKGFLIDDIRQGSTLTFNTSTRHRSDVERKTHTIKDKAWEELKLEKGGDYPLLHPSGQLTFLRYKKVDKETSNVDARWRVYTKSSEGEKELFVFPPLFQINQIFAFHKNKKEWLVFSSYDYLSERPYTLWALEVTGAEKRKPILLHESEEIFKVINHCDGRFFLQFPEGGLKSVDMTVIGQVRTRSLNLAWLDELVELRWDQENTVFTLRSDPLAIYHLPKGCREISKEILTEVETQTIKTQKEALWRGEKVDNEIEHYPSFSHFKPQWWFFNYVGGEGYDTVSILTSLNDPLEKHSLDLELKYFIDIEEVTPTGTYVYDLSGYDLGIGYNKFLSDSSLKSTADENISVFSFISKNFKKWGWDYDPSLLINQAKTSDFLGQRDSQSVSFAHAFSLLPIMADSFFQGLNLVLTGSFQNSEKQQDFIGEEFKFLTSLQPIRYFKTHFSASYGKLFKDSLSGGAIFSGGTRDLGTSGFHSFYGIDTNDAFGNEVFTSRLQFDFEVFDHYRGIGLVPFYLERTHFLMGADYLKTDFIFIEDDKRFLRNKELASVHAGIGLDITAFYFVPVQVDFLATKLINKYGSDTIDGLFFIKGQFGF
jgi:hypothetical protein